MSRYKKYLRVYINGKKVRSTGTHIEDFKDVLNYFSIYENFFDTFEIKNFNIFSTFKFTKSVNEIFSTFNTEQVQEKIDKIKVKKILNDSVRRINKEDKCIRFDIELVNKVIRDGNLEEIIVPLHIRYKFIKVKNKNGEKCWIYASDNVYNSINTDFYDVKLYKYNLYNTNKTLISHIPNVITCENYSTFSSLYYTLDNGEYKLLSDICNKVDNIDFLDDTWIPVSLVKFAIENNLKIGLEAYKAICQSYANLLDCEYIDKYNLPSYDEFKSVIVEDYGERHNVLPQYQNHEYESYEKWRYYNE